MYYVRSNNTIKTIIKISIELHFKIQLIKVVLCDTRSTPRFSFTPCASQALQNWTLEPHMCLTSSLQNWTLEPHMCPTGALEQWTLEPHMCLTGALEQWTLLPFSEVYNKQQ